MVDLIEMDIEYKISTEKLRGNQIISHTKIVLAYNSNVCRAFVNRSASSKERSHKPVILKKTANSIGGLHFNSKLRQQFNSTKFVIL